MIIVALLREPNGWRKLQAMAQRERDPQKLASIIDQMNCLLDRHEKMTAACDGSDGNGTTGAPDNIIPKIDLQTEILGG
jgi:hypothetical protein